MDARTETNRSGDVPSLDASSLPARPGFLSRLAIGAMGATIGIGGVAKEAEAGFYADGTTSAQTTGFGSMFAGDALSLRLNVPGVGSGQRTASAAFLNSKYAITSAHNIDDLLQYNPTFEVANGTNYLTSRGTVMPVSRVLFHPEYDGTRNKPDIAILEFAEQFTPTADKRIGVATPGEVATFAGFGQWGTPSTSIVRDGSLRAWDARVESTSSGFSAQYYQSASFGYNNSGLILNGRGLNGDSGGPVFNQYGDLIGISDSATLSTGQFGATVYLRLGEPAVQNWLAANTAVPEPSSLGVAALAAVGLLSRRRRS